MHRFFIHLYYLISKNRFISIAVALGILIICGFFVSKINFEEDINQIIPKNEKSDLTAKVLTQLNFSDKIIVIVEKKSKDDKVFEGKTLHLTNHIIYRKDGKRSFQKEISVSGISKISSTLVCVR